jgi:hypothetical protein
MRRLFISIGFAWTVRVVGFIFLFSLLIGNLLLRPRIKPSKDIDAKIIDLSALKDLRFALLGVGIFFSDWALFGPLTFITSYSLSKGINPNLSYYMIAFLNVGSSLGRVVPGLLADKIGPYVGCKGFADSEIQRHDNVYCPYCDICPRIMAPDILRGSYNRIRSPIWIH